MFIKISRQMDRDILMSVWKLQVDGCRRRDILMIFLGMMMFMSTSRHAYRDMFMSISRHVDIEIYS